MDDDQPQQQPTPPGALTLGSVVGLILVAVAIYFIIQACSSMQEADRHQRNAECHLQRADAILNGDPSPPACPDN